MPLTTSDIPEDPMQNTQENSNEKPGLGVQFGIERARAWEVRKANKGIREFAIPEVENPCTDDEFLAMFGNLTVEEVDSTIDRAKGITERNPDGLTEEQLPKNIELQYKQGNIFCPVLLPFDEKGRVRGEGIKDLTEEEWRRLVDNGALMRFLSADSKDYLTAGYVQEVDGYFYDLLPPFLKKDISEGGCSFKIEYPETMINHPINRQWFLEKYKRALENLRDFIKTSVALRRDGVAPN